MGPASADASVLLETTNSAVATIRLNRPERLNSVDEPMIAALTAALDKAAADPKIRVVVLAGAGSSFLTGADLTLFRNLDQAPETARRLIDGFHAMLRTIRKMPKPVIAALNGPVAGGGLGLALACDLAVMAENATLLSAYTRLGTTPDAGTTWSLVHLVGRRRALEVIWLNDRIDAHQALTMGLVNKVVPEADLESQTIALAKRLAVCAPEVVGRVKRLVDDALLSTLDAQLDRERESFAAAADSNEFREGICAFFERRDPRF